MVLSILLTILKFIGILLLAILALILFLLLLVLFVPIVYQVRLQKEPETSAEGIIKVSWLFRIISLAVEYSEGKMKNTIRIFGIKLGKKAETKPKRNGQRRKTAAAKAQQRPKPKPPERPPEKPALHPMDNPTAKPADKPAQDSMVMPTDSPPHAADVPPKETSAESATPQVKQTKATDKSPKKNKQDKKPKKKKKPAEQSERLLDKLKALWQTEHKKEILTQVKLLLQRLIRALTHGHLSLSLRIGTGAPDTTGYVLAGCYALSGVFGLDITVEGDFEQAILAGIIRANGRIFLYQIVLAVLRFALNKYIWPLIKKELFS